MADRLNGFAACGHSLGVAAERSRGLADTVGIVDPESLIRIYYPRMLRTAFLLCGNLPEAEDLAQDTAVQAMKSWTNFRGDSEPATWLYRIAIRMHARSNRTERRYRKRCEQWASIQRQAAQPSQPDQVLLEQEWSDGLWAAVSRLPDSQKHVVALRFAEDLSVRQIAEILNCPQGTVKSRLHHALQQLRSVLQRDAAGEGDVSCQTP